MRRATPLRSHELNLRAMSARACKFCVASQQRGVQRFRQYDICCIARGQIRPERPHAAQQRRVWMPRDGEQPEIRQRLFGTHWRQLPREQQTPQRLCNFNIDKIRGVDLLVRVQHLAGDRPIGPEYQFDRSRRIEYDQRESRSWRRIAVGEMLPV